VCAGESPGEILRRLRRRRDQGLRQPDRQRHAERVTVSSGVLHRNHARMASDVDDDRPARTKQLLQRVSRIDARATGDLFFGQVA
jgi:hypothetical protein